MDSVDKKRQFAAAWLRLGDPFKAAFAICDGNNSWALCIARDWANDPFVVQTKEALLQSSDAKDFLPTKEQQAKDIYMLATEPKASVEDRLKAHRLYAEVMGHIEKPVPSNAGVSILNQGVMLVRDLGSDADWEARSKQQQKVLTVNAATVN